MDSSVISSCTLGIAYAIVFLGSAHAGPCIQPRATCNATEVFECYRQFTSQWLREVLNNASDISTPSGPQKFEMCSLGETISSCKLDLQENCVADVNKYHKSELAYRSQRKIFCDQKKVQDYVAEYKCLEQNERHANCLRNILKNSTADDSTADDHQPSFCHLTLTLLECADLAMKCTSGDSSLYREVLENDIRLGGCVTPEPSRSSAPFARVLKWLHATALYSLIIACLSVAHFQLL